MYGESIQLNLEGIFRKIFERADLVIAPDLSANDVPGWNSFKQIDIILSVEEFFGIEFDINELDELKNVGDLMRLIEQRLNSASRRDV